MINWGTLAFAVLATLGIACCAIGALSVIAAGMFDDILAGNQAEREGCMFGAIGLALIAVAVVVKFL